MKIKYILKLAFENVHQFKNFNPEESKLIISDPRSGGTWLAELLNCIPHSLLIDEPLNLTNNRALEKLNFSWRQYIPENTDWNEAKTYFQHLFSGKKIDHKYSKLNFSSLKAKSLIFKFIRAKGLLPFILKNFEFKYRPIVLLRNPYAIMASLKNHHAFNYKFREFEIPDSRYMDFLENDLAFLKSLKTNEEQQLAWWCINNSILKESSSKDWILLNYEDLITNFTESMKLIFSNWSLPIPDSLWQNQFRVSSSSNKTEITTDNQLNGWKHQLSKEEIDRYKLVLNYFEIDYEKLKLDLYPS